MPSCVIYARYSDRPDADVSESVDDQIEQCRQFAAREGWTVEAVQFDKAMSGADPSRPGLLRAVDMLKRGSVLLVTRLDRIARDVMISTWVFTRAESKGARVRSILDEGTVGNQNDPTLKFMRTVMAACHELERAMIGSRTSASMRTKQARGQKMSRFAPFGWRDTGDGLVVVEREQEAIAEVRRMREEGRSLREIARAMEAVVPGRWSHQKVSAILRRSSGIRVRPPKRYARC